MSDDWNDTNDDDNTGQDGPKALRDALKKAQQELAAQREANAKLEASNRNSQISGILRDEGYSPKIAALVPHTVEPAKEKLLAWLDENSELFPKAAPDTPTTADSSAGSGDVVGEQIPEDRMASAVAMGLPADQVRNVEAQIDSAKTPEDLTNVLSGLRGVRFK
jgi:hypothetical protein